MPIPANAAVSWGLIEPQRITEGITQGQMTAVMEQASEDAEKEIKRLLAKDSFSSAVRAEQLKMAVAGMDDLTRQMWSDHEKLIRGGMFQNGALAADQSLDMDLFLGMPGGAVVQYADLIHWNAAQAVDDLISRHSSGYTLADRIYANGTVTTRTVGNIVDKALVQNLSAREIAKQVRGYYSPDVPGGASYAAMRLGRTEINNAHHHTTIRLSDDKPWVVGYKWNLSKSHPKPDPCDELANADDFELGAGVYERGSAPDRPHPQCLCYLTHLMEDEEEFMNNLVSGEYDDKLSSRGVVC